MVGPVEPSGKPIETPSPISVTGLSGTDSKICAVGKRSISAPSDSAAAINVSAAQIDVEDLALRVDGGIGYKAANLVKLEVLGKRLGFLVPPFMALSHNEMFAHITNYYPTIPLRYSRFVNSLGNPPHLTDKGRAILTEIRAMVEEAFSEANLFDNSAIRDLIESGRAEYLIVRSTGREDSDKISNAGGNLSIPYTKPTVKDVSINIGAVIVSYFSEKSILQRIASNDTTLTTERIPFVPVLVQEHVGERVGSETGKIPRSGVIFIKPNVSEIAVGLGHNEGIVTSSVPVDTYRFTSNGNLRAVVVEKTVRFKGVMGASGKVECRPVSCVGRIVEEPALTPSEREHFHDIAEGLRKEYNTSLDGEWTTNEEGQIVFLQLRPLNEPTPKEPPSYLKNPEEVTNCETLIDAGCYVREIGRKEEVIVCQTITDAYSVYTSLPKERQEEINGVIIRETAPRTSHEAVSFISWGLPVLIVTEEIVPEPPFHIDPQQGLIAKGGEKSSGYISYPMPLKFSMQASLLVEAMHRQVHEPTLSRGEEIKRGLSDLRDRIGAPPAEKINTVAELRESFQKFKTGTQREIRMAVKQMTHFIYQEMQAKNITPKSRIEMIMVLENLLDIFEDEALTCEEMDLKQLYTIRLVEACLFQDGKEIIGGFSFLRSLKDIHSQRVGSAELGRPHTEATLQDIPFVKLGRLMLREDLQAIWTRVMPHLSEVPEEAKRVVKELFLTIESLGAGTEFVNVTLEKLLTECGLNRETISVDQTRVFFGRVAGLAVELRPDLDRALTLHQFVSEERANIDAWSSPEHVKKNIDRITRRLHEIGFNSSEESITATFERSSAAGRLILIQSFREVVRCYDEIIKSCTASTEYPSFKAKANDFLRLLHQYSIIMNSIRTMGGGRIDMHSKYYSLPPDLSKMSEMEAERNFQVSEGFDVSELIQTTARYFSTGEVVGASRLEEKFTLFHQRMEQDLALMSLENGLSQNILPVDISGIIKDIKLEGSTSKSLKYIKIDGGLITVELAFPLRQHGATLILKYDTVKKSIITNISIYGGNERNRWNSIEKLAQSIGDSSRYKVRSSFISNTVLKLSFSEIKVEEDTGMAINEILNSLVTASFLIADRKGHILQMLPHKFQSEKLVINEVMRNGLLLKYVHNDFKSNESLVMSALAQNVKGIEFVPAECQTKEMVLFVLEKDPYLLKYVAKSFLQDGEIVAGLLQKNLHLFQDVPPDVQTKEMVLAAVTKLPHLLEYVAEKFLKDKDLITMILQLHPFAIRCIPPRFQTEEMALFVVGKDDLGLSSLARHLQVNERVVIAALEKNPQALKYISQELQTENMGFESAKRNAGSLNFINKKFHANIIKRLEAPPS